MLSIGKIVGQHALYGIILSIGLSACSSPAVRPVKGEVSTSQVISLEDTKKQASVDRARLIVQSTEDLYTEAVNQHVGYFVPAHFSEIQDELERLRKMYQEYDPGNTSFFFSGPDEEDLFEQADMVTKLLNQAFVIKKMTESYLQKVLADKKYLDTQVISKYRREYKSIVDDIRELMDDIEDDESLKGFDDRRLSLTQRLRVFEVKLMKARVMAAPKQALRQLNQRQIPKSYKDAATAVIDLAHQIEKQPRNSTAIAASLAVATRMINRASSISAEVDWIKGVSRQDQESIVLKYHTDLANISDALLEMNFSDRPFTEQVFALKDALSVKQKRLVKAAIESTRRDAKATFEAAKNVAVTTALQMQQQKYEAQLELKDVNYRKQIADLMAANALLQRPVQSENDEMVAVSHQDASSGEDVSGEPASSASASGDKAAAAEPLTPSVGVVKHIGEDPFDPLQTER